MLNTQHPISNAQVRKARSPRRIQALHWALGIGCWILDIGLAVSASAGQPAEEVQWIGSKAISYDAELRYESEDHDRVEKDTGDRTRFTNLRTAEIINLHWSGFVYHPRFLQLTTTFGFLVEQVTARLDEPGLKRTTRHNDISPQYSIRGVFLPQHPVSLVFDLERHRASAASGFGQVAIADTQSERADVFYKGDPLAAQVYGSRSHSTQEQLGVGENRDTKILTHGASLTHTLPWSLTNLTYDADDTTEKVTNSTDLLTRFDSRRKSQNVALANQLRLDSTGGNTLNTRLGYRQESGEISATRFAAEERLHLTHTKQLTSDYSVRYSEDTIGPSHIQLTGEQIGLSHQLFDSLFTNLEGHASQETADSSTRDIQGASVNFNYRKKIPYGMLLLNAGYGSERTDETGASTVRPVLDESHVLLDTTTTFLGNVGIILSSVVVRDTTKTITYLVNIDYRLLSTGGLVEIRRIPTGAIADGATVLVNYSFNTGNPISFVTRNWNWRTELDLFEHFAVYAGVRDTRQTLLKGIDTGRLQNLHDTLYGARVHWGPLTATGEHEIYDSTLTPYTSDRATVDCNLRLTDAQTLVASASWRHVVYGTGGQSHYRNVSASYRLTPRHGPSLSLSAGHEVQDDRGFAGTFNYANAEASYRFRAVEFGASIRLNDRDDNFARERSSSILFTIKRTF